MNKVLYVAGIILSVLFVGTCFYYANAISEARIAALVEAFASENLMSFSSDYGGLTQEAAFVSLFFLAAFFIIDLMGLLKVKTVTAKVMSILGITFTGIMVIWDLLVISSPSSISFDEVALAFCFYSLIVLAFSIVGLVQSVKFGKRNSTPRPDLLDS